MSSLLPSMTRTSEETTSSERAKGTTGTSKSGGSRRRRLGLAAAGIGAMALLRRMRSNRGKQRSGSTGQASDTKTGGSRSSGGKRSSRLTGRMGRMVAGVVAAAAVRRLLRRWRRR